MGFFRYGGVSVAKMGVWLFVWLFHVCVVVSSWWGGSGVMENQGVGGGG